MHFTSSRDKETKRLQGQTLSDRYLAPHEIIQIFEFFTSSPTVALQQWDSQKEIYGDDTSKSWCLDSPNTARC